MGQWYQNTVDSDHLLCYALHWNKKKTPGVGAVLTGYVDIYRPRFGRSTWSNRSYTTLAPGNFGIWARNGQYANIARDFCISVPQWVSLTYEFFKRRRLSLILYVYRNALLKRSEDFFANPPPEVTMKTRLYDPSNQLCQISKQSRQFVYATNYRVLWKLASCMPKLKAKSWISQSSGYAWGGWNQRWRRYKVW